MTAELPSARRTWQDGRSELEILMCLGIPMKLTEIEDQDRGTAELEGVKYEVSLSLLESPCIGDFVIVHAGFAIEVLDEKEAEERLALFAELGPSMGRQ